MTGLPSRHGSHLGLPRTRVAVWVGLVALAAFLGSLLAVVPLPQSLTPRADAAAVLTVSQDIPGETLIGGETPVEVTFSNTGDEPAYNLAFSVTVPVGVTLSSADQPPTRTIVETDGAGNPTGTVYEWENVVDVAAGSVFHFRYSLQHVVGTGPGQWEVNETIDAPVGAWFATADATVPTFPDPGTTDPVEAGQPTGADVVAAPDAPGQTTLVPVLLTKAEPSPEAELLRGVHDHQTVYTLTLETGTQGGVDIGTVEDWIPAGLEFLACGDVDNSAGEEYPGSGPLTRGNTLPPARCPAPVTVETVSSGLPAGLAPGVYTHVVWDIGDTLGASSTSTISYVAGIPQRENTMSWPGATPGTGGAQAANLDNNTGPLTTQVGDGTTWTNQAQVSTTFDGRTSLVTDTETVQAVDLSEQKYVDTPTIAQGGVSTWTIRLQTSEYVTPGGIAAPAVRDTTPDGTCPIDTTPTPCTTLTSPPPSSPYDAYTYDPATGRTALEWDLPSGTFGPNESGQLTFSTEALTTYHNGDPVSANDSWTNTTDLEANVTTFDERGPTDPLGHDTNAVTDDSSATQSGSAVEFTKDVGVPAPGQQCGDGSAVTWQPEIANDVGPGDRVCFRLTATAPSFLDTRDVDMVDFLPIGFNYEDSEPGPANEVPENLINNPAVSPPSPTDAQQRVDFTLVDGAVIEPAQTAQAVISALFVAANPPDLGTNGATITNRARYSFQNTGGEVFVKPDDAAVGFEEAHLTLSKGISANNATTYAPPVDPLRDVVENDVVEYAITVTNDGDRDAADVVVWDLLPRNAVDSDLDAACADLDPVAPDFDSCSDADGRITWTLDELAAGDSVVLRYTWTLPAGSVPPGNQWTNRAGIVEYHSDTNRGTDFTYVPRNNVDESRNPDANTDRADDTANIYSPGITIEKTRTTSVAEPGNREADQATIGETISYTIETRQTGGTTADQFVLTDDLTGRGQTVAGTPEAASGLVQPGGTCSETTPRTVDTSTPNVLTVSIPEEVTPPDGEVGCLVLRFDAVVDDVPTGGSPLNVRPNNVTNDATISYRVGGVGGPTAAVTDAVATQVVEPDIAIIKDAGAGSTVLPGAEVPYTLVVTNRSGTAVGTAHDIQVVDDLSGTEVDAVVDAGGGTVAGDTITWDLGPDPDGDGTPGLSPGASVTLSYRVRLNSPLTANTDLTNTATVTTTSMAGGPAGERTADSACSPATCPGYEDSDSETVTVAGPLFDKTTATPLSTPGDLATYTVRALFPRGLDFGATFITDDLAGSATAYVRTVSAACVNCTAAERDALVLPEDAAPPATDPATWDLGTLEPRGATRIWTITFEARVLDQPGNVAGATLTNTAELTYATGSLDDTAAVPLAEPDVAIAKQVETDVDTTPGAAARGRIGGTVTYHLQVTNTGGWTAYDVAVTDEPDTDETGGCTVGTPRVTVPSGGLADGVNWSVTDDTLGAGDACLGFSIDALLPGATATITYTLDIPADFPTADLVIGPELVNVADVGDYFGVVDHAGNPQARTYDGPDDTASVDLDGGALGNLVWLDVDGDGNGPDTPGGAADPGEPGIPDVDVTVTWAGPDGAFGSADDETYPRTTDATGRWNTNDTTSPPTLLPAGEYEVVVDTATLPAGLANSFDPDGAPLNRSEVSLAENAEDLDQDFGYAGTGSLGDRVWLDLDRDGVQDAGEPGLDGVDVTVTWAGFDGVLGTSDDVDHGVATTVGDGGYTVENLPAGDYEVTVDGTTLPVGGVSPTYDLDDGTTSPDGVAVRTLGAGEDATDVDFGYGGTGRIGDTVWFDTDADGAQAPTEPGIAGVGMEAIWAGVDGVLGNGDDVTFTRTTDADGEYLVDGVPAGPVRVTVVAASLPGDLVATYDLDDGTTAPDGTAEATLASGEENLDLDFGYRGPRAVGDLVWLDVDGDAFGPDTPGADADPAEPGVPGQRVRVVWAGRDDDLATTADNVTLGTVQTGADGRWGIDGVPTGRVSATLVGAPADTLRVSYDNEGARDGVGIDEVAAGADNLTYDFGLAGTGSLGDDVWLDVDRDGVVDDGEPRIPDVDVRPVWAGFDGAFGTADDVDYGTRTTDAAGTYLVDQLPPGRYRATVVAGSLPAGVAATYDLDSGTTAPDGTTLRTLAPGENARDVDFGYAGTGRIGDYVWWDLDGDGVQDPAEPGLPDVGVTLDWAGFDGTFGTADDGRLRSATGSTGSGQGDYLFTGLPAGSYRVTVTRADLPAGVRATADPDGGADSTSTLTLAGGASDLDQDFGYVGDAAIGDLVWRDINDDGDRQAREPALAGAGVTVTYLGPDGVAGGGDDVAIRQTTGNPPSTAPRATRAARGGAPAGDDPFYLVTGLAPGRYVVTLDGDTIEAPDAPSSDLDGGDPTVTRLTLGTGPELDADFAVFRNDEPTSDGDAEASLGCDETVVIDPFAAVSDANGDELRIVRDSVQVTGDGTAERTDDGRLRINATGDEDFTVRYTAADGRGGTVDVSVAVQVDEPCPGGGDDGGGIPLPATGATIPLWLVWLAVALLTSGGVLVVASRRRRTGASDDIGAYGQ